MNAATTKKPLARTAHVLAYNEDRDVQQMGDMDGKAPDFEGSAFRAARRMSRLGFANAVFYHAGTGEKYSAGEVAHLL